MQYYIVRKQPENVIFKVRSEDEAGFRKKYNADILVEADSLMMLLLRFEQEILDSHTEEETGPAGVQPAQQ